MTKVLTFSIMDWACAGGKFKSRYKLAQGTGPRLSIVKQIVERLGGELGLDQWADLDALEAEETCPNSSFATSRVSSMSRTSICYWCRQ